MRGGYGEEKKGRARRKPNLFCDGLQLHRGRKERELVAKIRDGWIDGVRKERMESASVAGRWRFVSLNTMQAQ